MEAMRDSYTSSAGNIEVKLLLEIVIGGVLIGTNLAVDAGDFTVSPSLFGKGRDSDCGKGCGKGGDWDTVRDLGRDSDCGNGGDSGRDLGRDSDCGKGWGKGGDWDKGRDLGRD